MTRCEKCENEVSTKADACPHCGIALKEGLVLQEDTPLLVLCRRCTHVQEASEKNRCDHCGADLKTGALPKARGCFVKLLMSTAALAAGIYLVLADTSPLTENRSVKMVSDITRDKAGRLKYYAGAIRDEARAVGVFVQARFNKLKSLAGSKVEVRVITGSAGEFKDSENGARYRINAQGDLEVYDNNMLVRTIKQDRSKRSD